MQPKKQLLCVAGDVVGGYKVSVCTGAFACIRSLAILCTFGDDSVETAPVAEGFDRLPVLLSVSHCLSHCSSAPSALCPVHAADVGYQITEASPPAGEHTMQRAGILDLESSEQAGNDPQGGKCDQLRHGDIPGSGEPPCRQHQRGKQDNKDGAA